MEDYEENVEYEELGNNTGIELCAGQILNEGAVHPSNIDIEVLKNEEGYIEMCDPDFA
jgi:hypothetical protein